MKQLFLFLLLLAAITACKKSEDAPKIQPVMLDKTDVQLHYDETYPFKLTQGGTDIDETTYAWVSKDTTVGKVDTKGVFYGNHIGETTVTATSKDGKTKVEAKVTVTPKTTMFKMPVIEFGSSKANVKSKETRVMTKDSASLVVYQPENAKIRQVFYYFENAALKESYVLPGTTTALIQEAGTYLDERFTYLGQDNDGAYYFEVTPTVIAVYFSDQNLGPAIGFAAYKKGGRLPAQPGRSAHFALTLRQRPR